MAEQRTRGLIRWVRALVILWGVGLITYAVLLARYWEADGCRVAALTYHEVVADEEPSTRLHLRRSDFRSHLEELRQAGARILTAEELIRFAQGAAEDGCPWASPAVLITFDLHGSYDQQLTAVPLLEEFGMPALFFVLTGPVDSDATPSDHSWTARVQGLAAAGMQVGSHTQRHPDMRHEPVDSLAHRLAVSREFLGEVTGREPISVAAPGGRYNESAIDAVERAGFMALFTSDPCYVKRGSDLHRLCRVEIRGDRGMTALGASESPGRVAVQAANWRIKRWIEATIGSTAFFFISELRARLGGYAA